MKNYGELYLNYLILALIAAALVLRTAPVSSQGRTAALPDCIINGSLTPNAVSGNMNTDDGHTVNGWHVSHGSPTVGEKSPTGGGSHAVLLWSFNGKGEGMYTSYGFKRGRTYNISMTVFNDNTDEAGVLRIVAANGLKAITPPETGTGDATIPAPQSQELVDDSHVNAQEPVKLNFNYTPTSNFDQLWIYPYNPTLINGQPYILIVDMISVVEAPIISNNSPVACGSTIELSVTNEQSCAWYTWYDANDRVIGNGATLKLSNADPDASNIFSVSTETGDSKLSSSTGVTVESNCGSCEFVPDFERIGCNEISFSDITLGKGKATGWTWDFGDGSTSNEQNPTHTYSSTGTRGVFLTVTWTSPKGEVCSRTVNKNIEVCDPDPCSFTPKFDIEDCNPVNFTDATRGIGNATKWHWDFGDGKTSRKQNPTHKYSAEGTYDVILTVTFTNYAGNTCEKTFVRSIAVCEPEPCDFKPDFRWDDCRSPLAFQDMTHGTGRAASYMWDFGDGTVSELKEPTHHYIETGTYQVSQKVEWVTDEGRKCQKVIAHEVNICNTTVLASNEPRMVLYPNPAITEVIIATSHMPASTTVHLRNESGSILGEATKIGEGQYRIHVQHLASSIYIVTAAAENIVISKRLIKE